MSLDVMSAAEPFDTQRLGIIRVMALDPRLSAVTWCASQVASQDGRRDGAPCGEPVGVSGSGAFDGFLLDGGPRPRPLGLQNPDRVPKCDPRSALFWGLALIPGTHVIGVPALRAGATGAGTWAPDGARREVHLSRTVSRRPWGPAAAVPWQGSLQAWTASP